jgi:hypothetical protein
MRQRRTPTIRGTTPCAPVLWPKAACVTASRDCVTLFQKQCGLDLGLKFLPRLDACVISNLFGGTVGSTHPLSLGALLEATPALPAFGLFRRL